MADRAGPLQKVRFKVELDGVEVTGFDRIDLPGRSTELVETNGRKQWGQTEYEDLTVVRMMPKGDSTLSDWRKSVDQGKTKEARKNLDVVLQDETGNAQIRWEFTTAWPKRYEPPTLEVSPDGDDVAHEKLTIAFDEMKRKEL